MSKEATPRPWGDADLKFDWRIDDNGDADCGIFTESFQGHALAIARCPRYFTKAQWRRTAAYLCNAGNSYDDLIAALEPFGHIDGEGDEDFPDDTPVVIKFGRTTNHSLTLGDLRRASSALSKAQAPHIDPAGTVSA